MIFPPVCPSTLQPGYSTFSPRALKTLFGGRKVSHVFSGQNPANSSEDEIGPLIRQIGRISLSGAQPKFSAVIGEDNKLRYAFENEQGTYILKPSPFGNHIRNKEFCAANENLTMQLASQIYGIDVAPNGLIFFEDGAMAYITKRFDIGTNCKYPQEDFAALMGYTKEQYGSEYKYSRGSYEECGEIIKQFVKASLPDLRRFFKQVVFNFLTLNDDAHLKNFSLIERDGEYTLSPAYDLINTSLHLWEHRIFALDKGLMKEGMKLTDTRTVKREDFEELGKRLGLPRRIVKNDLEMFLEKHKEVEELIGRSFLPEEMKRQYESAMDFRRMMLTF